jgi:hypothetical protein
MRRLGMAGPYLVVCNSSLVGDTDDQQAEYSWLTVLGYLMWKIVQFGLIVCGTVFLWVASLYIVTWIAGPASVKTLLGVLTIAVFLPALLSVLIGLGGGKLLKQMGYGAGRPPSC